jgi:hypothetical protein
MSETQTPKKTKATKTTTEKPAVQVFTTPEHFFNTTTNLAVEETSKKRVEKQKSNEKLNALKQLRADTLQRLYNYLVPFHNRIININQPLIVRLALQEATLSCSPLFSVSSRLDTLSSFSLTLGSEDFTFFPDSSSEVNDETFQSLLKRCQHFLVEGLSNS